EDATKETKMATASDGRRRGGDGGNTAARAADWLDPVARLGESAARGTERQERTPLWTGFREETATRRPASGRPPRATTPAGASGGRKLHGTHRDMLIPRVLLGGARPNEGGGDEGRKGRKEMTGGERGAGRGPAPIGRTINQKTVALLQAAGKMARFTAGSWIRSADPSAEDHDDGTDLLLGSRRARAGRPNGRLGPIAQGHAARPLPSPPRARAPPGDDERKSTHGVKSRDGTHLPR
ncbi:unnamed protein product, partial [Prorocentrum cordatum]